MKSLAAAIFAAVFAVTLSAQTSAPPAAGEKFVPTALCRLLDTRMTPPANAAEATMRQVDVRTTMCSPLLPPFATAYAIRTTSYSLLPPEKVPVSDRPVVTTTRIVPGKPLHFPVPPSRNITVDVDGYFVPVGMPLSPVEQSLAGTSTLHAGSAAASHPPLIPGSNTSLTGNTGAVYTDGTAVGFTSSGLLLQATSTSAPFLTAQTSTSDASSSFSLINSNRSAIMTVTGDGTLTIPTPSIGSFLNSRTQYWPPSVNGVTPMPGDYVHNVVIQNPRNAENDSTTRVVFFQGGTLGENGSPPVTKFQAYTAGTTQESRHINFDSMVYYHWNQYHFRAFSYVENKDTFWVKAATSGTSATNTRADMYVSGNVGIGTTPGNSQFEVAGDARVDGNLTLGGTLIPSGNLTISGGTSANPVSFTTGVTSTGFNATTSAGENLAGTAANYYGGGAQSGTPGSQVNGPPNGDGSAYTYGHEGDTTGTYFGGRAGGYFAGGSAVQYAGGGAGLMAIGGNAMSTTDSRAPGSTAHGGAGLYARGGLNADGSPTWAAWFAGTTVAAGTANAANLAGTVANYYGGGAQSATANGSVNGPANGDGSPYTYGAEGASSTGYFGGKTGGQFLGGKAAAYGGGGVGLQAIGGDAISSSDPSSPGSSAHGGAGLYARGGLNADGTHTWAGWFEGNVHVTGELTGANVHAQFQDVAEWVPASEVMTAGTVVVLNASKANEVMASFRAYDTSVAGVVSEKPGVILGSASPSKAQIATTGRVKVKVDATNHPVAVGDLLVTSDKPGMAMVSEPVDLGGVKIHRPGTLIGKALEPLPSGEGEILVLLSLQ